MPALDTQAQALISFRGHARVLLESHQQMVAAPVACSKLTPREAGLFWTETASQAVIRS